MAAFLLAGSVTMRRLLIGVLLVGMLGASAGPILAQGGGGFLPADLEPITAANVDRLEVLGRLGLGYVNDLYWSPDGDLLVLGGNNHFWTYDMTAPAARPEWHAGHLDPQAEGVVCTPDEISAIETCWDVLTGVPIWTWPELDAGSVEFQWIHPSRDYAVRDVKLAEPETGYRLEVYAIASGERVYTYLHESLYPHDTWGEITQTRFVPPATWLYVQDAAVWQIDLATGDLAAVPMPPVENPMITFSPDGSLGIVQNEHQYVTDNMAHYDYQLIIWEIASGEVRLTWDMPDSLSGEPLFDIAMTRIALPVWDGIAIWDFETGEQVKYLAGPVGGTLDMGFDGTADRLLQLSIDNFLVHWDIRAEESTELRDEFAFGNIFHPYELALDATGSMLASMSALGWLTGDLVVWDLQEGAVVQTADVYQADMRFRADGTLLIGGSVYAMPHMDFISSSPRVGYPPVQSGDGRYVTGYHDPAEIERDVVRIGDVDTGAIVAELPIPFELQNDLSLNQDGTLLAAMGKHRFEIWDVRTSALVYASIDVFLGEDYFLTGIGFLRQEGRDFPLIQYQRRPEGCMTIHCGFWRVVSHDPASRFNTRILAADYFGFPNVVDAWYVPEIGMVVMTSGTRVQGWADDLTITEGATLSLWNLDTEQPALALDGQKSPTFSGDGRVLATVRDGVIWLWGVRAE